MTRSRDSAVFEGPDSELAHYDLTLFVSGASDLSARAVANARELCETHFAGRYHLDVVDIHVDPPAASSRLLATPTLVRNLPLPVCQIVGDLSDSDKVLLALEAPAVNPVPQA
ncbi:MAG: circadian clock protein KaiB [Actinomycetota bacterium]|nr:circadian clock protein KaiB [Actinomycetota bacterium]